MSRTLTVHLERPVMSAKILGNYPDGIGTGLSGRAGVNLGTLEAQKAVFSQACQTLKGIVAKLNQFYDKIIAGHEEEIARLSVEIARKILMQKVESGDYEIESIIKEALKNAPTPQDVVVRLNPRDLVQCQKAQQDEPAGDLAGIKFVSDPNIGRAECLLESPKGIIESLINEHLERVGKALKKVE